MPTPINKSIVQIPPILQDTTKGEILTAVWQIYGKDCSNLPQLIEDIEKPENHLNYNLDECNMRGLYLTSKFKSPVTQDNFNGTRNLVSIDLTYNDDEIIQSLKKWLQAKRQELCQTNIQSLSKNKVKKINR